MEVSRRKGLRGRSCESEGDGCDLDMAFAVSAGRPSCEENLLGLTAHELEIWMAIRRWWRSCDFSAGHWRTKRRQYARNVRLVDKIVDAA